MIDVERLRLDLQSSDCQTVAEAATMLMAAGEHLDPSDLEQTRACLLRTHAPRSRVDLARAYLHLLDADAGSREAERLLRTEEYPEVRDEAFHALVDFGERAMPVLRDLARSRSTSVRWYAYRAAGHIPGAESLRLLVDGLQDEDEAVRLSAAKALVDRGEEAVIAVVHAVASREPSPGFHRAARMVLQWTAVERHESPGALIESLGGPWSVYQSGFIARRLLGEWARA